MFSVYLSNDVHAIVCLVALTLLCLSCFAEIDFSSKAHLPEGTAAVSSSLPLSLPVCDEKTAIDTEMVKMDVGVSEEDEGGMTGGLGLSEQQARADAARQVGGCQCTTK